MRGLLSFLLCGLLVFGGSSTVSACNPVYVSVAGHIEENAIYYQNCDTYAKNRLGLLNFAEIIKAYNVSFNLQVSYEWLKGVQDCDSVELKKQTLGLNILDYLVQE